MCIKKQHIINNQPTYQAETIAYYVDRLYSHQCLGIVPNVKTCTYAHMTVRFGIHMYYMYMYINNII
jgi:hypothetical protein